MIVDADTLLITDHNDSTTVVYSVLIYVLIIEDGLTAEPYCQVSGAWPTPFRDSPVDKSPFIVRNRTENSRDLRSHGPCMTIPYRILRF